MSTRKSRKIAGKTPLPSIPERARQAGAGVPAWEEIEAGRYMPRRIRGSLRGRELG